VYRFVCEPMDGYLKRRLSNPAYGGNTICHDESSAYKRFAFERSIEEQQQQVRTNAHPLQMVRHEASASKLYHATDNAKKGPCWTGYHKVEGMADYADGSCKPNGKKKKKSSDKKKKKKKEKKEGDKSSSESDSDDEHKKKSKD